MANKFSVRVRGVFGRGFPSLSLSDLIRFVVQSCSRRGYMPRSRRPRGPRVYVYTYVVYVCLCVGYYLALRGEQRDRASDDQREPR